MSSVGTTLTDQLEPRSQTLFLIGGVLVLSYGALLGYEAVTSTASETVGGVLAGSGGAIAFLGLLGLYPRIADRTPWLARTAAGATIVGTIGFSVVALGSAARLLGLVSSGPSEGPTVAFPLVLIGMILGFALFSIATYRASPQSSRLPLLLGAPAVVMVLIVGSGAAGLTQPWVPAVLGTVHGLSYLAIGAALRAGIAPGTHSDTSADSFV